MARKTHCQGQRAKISARLFEASIGDEALKKSSNPDVSIILGGALGNAADLSKAQARETQLQKLAESCECFPDVESLGENGGNDMPFSLFVKHKSGRFEFFSVGINTGSKGSKPCDRLKVGCAVTVAVADYMSKCVLRGAPSSSSSGGSSSLSSS